MLDKKILHRVLEHIKSSKRIQLLIMLVGFAILIACLVNFNLSNGYYGNYRLGEIAERTVKAYRTIEFEDVDATIRSAKDAEKQVPPIFDYDHATLNSVKQRIHDTFQELRAEPNITNAKKIFEEQIGRTLDSATDEVFQRSSYSWRLERALLFVISAVPDRYIIDDKELVVDEGLGEIIINDITTKKKEPARFKTVDLIHTMVTTNEVHKMMNNKLSEIADKLSPPERQAISTLAGSLIRANLTLNKEKTILSKQMARERNHKVIVKINKGDVVIKEGDSVNARQLTILSELKKMHLGYHDFLHYVFYIVLFFLSFLSLVLYTRFSLYMYKPRMKDIFVLGFCLFSYTFFIKLWAWIATALSGYLPGVPTQILMLMFPYISMAFVVRVILYTEYSALMSIVAAVIVGTMSEGDFGLVAYVLFSGFLASAMIVKFDERKNLFRAGFLTGIFQAVFAVLITLSKLYAVDFSWYHVLMALGAGFISGLLASFVTEAVMPVFEYVFNYTTNVKLLELANTNHPLLRDFLIKAPGTYNHSMIVGQLASAGADATGANSLLARVGSYYHDIGKIGKAVYFIENQQMSMNPHNKLNPSMSARILVSHVKDGVKLAREWKLGRPIIDIIQQHHGTSLMKFFFAKAQEQNKEVNELDYRYPGPKPKSREAVLVMIADSCEAACRSLEDPTPARIRTTVDTIINNMFVDGQFDECNITLKRLKIISQIYTKILITLHHNRIEYPETVSNEGQNANSFDKRRWDKVTQKIVDNDGQGGSAETWL